MLTPSRVKLHKQSQQLEIELDGQSYLFSAEFLRVHSPSAEVKGHGPGQEQLQFGKKDVRIIQLDPVGNYAIKITFDDGHDSGIFAWDYLATLGASADQYWQSYLEKLNKAGKSRDTNVSTVRFVDATTK